MRECTSLSFFAQIFANFVWILLASCSVVSQYMVPKRNKNPSPCCNLIPKKLLGNLVSDMFLNLYNFSFSNLSEITLDFLSRLTKIKILPKKKCFHFSFKARISRRNSNTGASYGYRIQGEILIIIMVIFF